MAHALAELSGACQPALHWVQAVDPVVLAYRPGMQLEQTDMLDALVYAPVEQLMQTVAIWTEYLPASHWIQAVECVALENVPALQPWHTDAPMTSLYHPAAHSTHVLEADALE